MGEFAIQRGTNSGDGMLTLRDAVAPLFRQRRLAVVVFAGIFGGALLAAILAAPRYESEMKILVNRDRADEVVTASPDTRVVASQTPSVTEEDLNSEVELLKSRDLLEQVAIACNLESRQKGLWGGVVSHWDGLHGPQEASRRRTARAVKALESAVIAEPLKKTSLIRVSYVSTGPEPAAQVLRTLAALYEKKHAEVHRPSGTFRFFDLEAGRYRTELAAHEARLQNFATSKGLIDPGIQKQLALEQISQLQTELDQDRASIRAAQDRAYELKALKSASPERQTTVLRKSDNAELLAQLNGTLLSLELKRSEMLTKYAPNYPLVQEANAQIEDARKALAAAQQKPVEEVTTDRTPAQDWMATEMTKAETDRVALEGRAASIQQALRESKLIASRIDRESVVEADLIRDVKASEEDYLLYSKKREEARISDLLDQKRIVNVSVAETPTVPAFPERSWIWILAFGFFAAGGASAGAAYAADRLSPMFRTPDELGRYLDLRVLAAIPAKTLRQ